MANFWVPPPSLQALGNQSHVVMETRGKPGDGSRAGLGTDEWVEDSPEHRAGLRTLPAHNFMWWNFGIL